MKFLKKNKANLAFGRERERERERRNSGIDLAKGICILLMVVGHSGAPRLLNDAIYMFHMPCFFIISGWLFKEKYLDNIMSFIKRKVFTLWKPYVTWGLIFLCLTNAFIELNILNPPYLSKNDYIHEGVNILTMQRVSNLLGGFWFITSLFIASIVSTLWYKVIGNRLILIIAGIFLFLSVAFIFCHYSISTTFRTYTILAVAYFMAGTLLSRIKIPKGRLKTLIIIAAMLVLASGMLFIMSDERGWMTRKLIIPFFFSSVIISYAIIVVCTTSVPLNLFKWLETLGRRTFDILIFHFLAFKIVSLLKILYFDLPIDRLSDFPVIHDNNHIYWLIYATIGICGSLLFADTINALKSRSIYIFNKILNPIKK